MLHRKAPVPGTVWGCVVCGLPPDGATYVACDLCIAENRKPRWVMSGWASERGRLPIDDLEDETFDHDLVKHGAYEGLMEVIGWEGDFE